MTIAIDQITPITRKSDSADVATGAYDDLIGLLETLRDVDWTAPTECPGWDVSDMVGHLVGSAKAAASKRELLRQNITGSGTQVTMTETLWTRTTRCRSQSTPRSPHQRRWLR